MIRFVSQKIPGMHQLCKWSVGYGILDAVLTLEFSMSTNTNQLGKTKQGPPVREICRKEKVGTLNIFSAISLYRED